MPLLGILQILISLFLVVLILLQGRGAGLGATFGGGGETFRTRRGFEKILFYLTLLFAFAFVLILVAVLAV